jgi:hypothetical protein
MMSRPRTVALLAALAASSIALPAFAKGGAFKLGVGLGGVIGGNFLDKPSEKTLTNAGGQTLPAPDIYPGFAGMTAGGGLMIDARFIKLLGVELDVFRTSDKGSGDLSINNYKFHITLGQSAWHVPVLAKLVVPAPIVAPEFFVGPEFVFPGSGSLEVDKPGLPPMKATADNYTMIAFGAGLEIKLPLPAIDLRIPFQLRGGYNPGVSSKLSERINTTFDSPTAFHINSIKSEWKFQAVATLGAELYF